MISLINRMKSLPRTIALIERGIEDKLHIGAQLYVSRDRQTIAEIAIGRASPDETMTTDSIVPWMSAGKPLTAVAIAQLWQRKLLDLDDTIAKYIPEFAQRGKETITIRHCLTHTAGFRGPLNNFTRAPWPAIIDRICQMPLEPGWTPGQKAGYHIATSWFILGEIIQRVSNQLFDDYIRTNIFEPLDMSDSFFAISEEIWGQLNSRIVLLPDTSKTPPDFTIGINNRELNTIPRPGANFRAPARNLARFYESLLQSKIVSHDTVGLMTSPQRQGMFDHSFNAKIDFGFGFLLNTTSYSPETPYLYGPHASPQTFGHSGNQSSVAFADPAHKLVVALSFNGMPGEPAHQQRMREVLTSLYEEIL